MGVNGAPLKEVLDSMLEQALEEGLLEEHIVAGLKAGDSPCLPGDLDGHPIHWVAVLLHEEFFPRARCLSLLAMSKEGCSDWPPSWRPWFAALLSAGAKLAEEELRFFSQHGIDLKKEVLRASRT
jgi:hypothetical protein